ncbi:MAG: SPFH domain-containing protein [Pseudolysinimonas sp.]|jgi:regulator of protease activity HflC (stomatin/prohibitin superfamily)|uniref:SPFH domain-containing protein n=1 Tax=Pseudolysinimonas sp. TaxID=2680009 RepID=UPI003C722522
MFIVSLIFLLAGVVALIVAASNAKARVVAAGETPNGSAFRRGTNVIISRAARWAAVVLFVIGAAFLVFSSFFRQDVGQANVLRDWTGAIVGYQTAAGLHWKAPWVDTVTFDVRNQRAVFVSEQSYGEGDNIGGNPDGPQITVQDAEGVTANIDIAIRYSLDPDAVIDIYSAYYNEENLRTRLIFNDIRSVVRSVPGRYATIDMLTDRDAVQQDILEALERRWENDGIIVEDVALQEIRYGEQVTAAFAAAQEAAIQVQTEQNRLEAVQVSAQQKIVQAQAEAEANAILNASLTDAILQQRYLDTLKELAAAGNLVIVPEGFSGLVNVAR